MKSLGRFFQFAGLVALPAAMVLELSGGLGRSFGVSDMVIMLVFGFCMFYAGRYLEGYASG